MTEQLESWTYNYQLSIEAKGWPGVRVYVEAHENNLTFVFILVKGLC